MAKRKTTELNNVGESVVVKSVSGGTPEVYTGCEGVVEDYNRGLYAVLFSDGKTQYFTRNELTFI